MVLLSGKCPICLIPNLEGILNTIEELTPPYMNNFSKLVSYNTDGQREKTLSDLNRVTVPALALCFVAGIIIRCKDNQIITDFTGIHFEWQQQAV